MENDKLNLIHLLKKILISTEMIYHMKNKKIFNELEKKINLDNLIYNYKSEEKSPEDFINYHNPIDLFKNLRDGNINSNEVLV